MLLHGKKQTMREPLQQVMKTEPVRMLASHHSSSNESDDAGVEYLETMKKIGSCYNVAEIRTDSFLW